MQPVVDGGLQIYPINAVRCEVGNGQRHALANGPSGGLSVRQTHQPTTYLGLI